MRQIYFIALLLIWLGCNGKPAESNSIKNSESKVQDTSALIIKADSVRQFIREHRTDLDDDNMIDAIKEELKYRLLLNQPLEIGRCYRNLGLKFGDISRIDSSLHYLEKAKKYNPKDVKMLTELGRVFLSVGDFEQSTNMLKSALQNELTKGIPDIVQLEAIYVNLSNTLNEKKTFEEAKDYAEKGLNITNALHKGELLLNKGNALNGLQKYDKAREAYLQSLNFTEDDSLTKSTCLTNIGITYKYEKNYPKALDYMREGLSYKYSNIDIAASYNNLADIFLLQNKLDSAFRYYQKAITTILPNFKNNDWKTNPDKALFKNALSTPDLMGYLRDKANAIKDVNPQKAIETYRLADVVCDRIRIGSIEQESKFFWREEAYPLYLEAIELCYTLGLKDEAFSFFEKSRAVLLLDELYNNVQKNNANVQKIMPLDVLQKRLSNDEAFLEYFTLEDSMFVFSITKEKADFQKLYYPKDSIATFINFIKTNPQERPRKSRQSLYKLDNYLYEKLIDSLNLNSNIKHLIISTDGLLQNIPFEALKNDEKPILYQYEIQYAYSVSTLYLSEKKETPKTIFDVLCVAPVEFRLLPSETLDNTKVYSQKFQSRNNKVLTHQEASLTNFVAAAQDAKIIQLMTHARADSLTGIYFQDTLMPLSDLYRQKFPAALAVLTACETGTGKDAKGEGAMSLANGFAHAGVPATVATLWSIQEDQTLKINELFYEYLKQGWTKSKALRQAKIDFLNSTPPELPAYYWAAPILYGDDTPIASSKGYGWLWLIVLFFIAIIIVLVKKVRKNQTPSIN